MIGTLTDNIELVRTHGDIAHTFTDTYVVTNPAWNKRLAELSNVEAQAETPEWAASFIAYMEDELSKLQPYYDCDVSDPKLGRKSDRYYFEVIWF